MYRKRKSLPYLGQMLRLALPWKVHLMACLHLAWVCLINPCHRADQRQQKCSVDLHQWLLNIKLHLQHQEYRLVLEALRLTG